MKTKYQCWIETQDPNFIKEIHAGEIPLEFKDDKKSTEIDLNGLAELDSKYIPEE